MIDQKFLLPTEVENEKSVEKGKTASLANKLDHPALINPKLEMSKTKLIRKAPHNLTLLRVNDLTTVEKERNAQKEIAVQIGAIMIAEGTGSNHKIDTLTQDILLPAIIATLPATTLPITTTILPLDNDSTLKSVIVIAMIETFLTNGTCDTIPHTIITVEIIHRHLMPIHNAEICLMCESITLFLKKLPKKF